MKITQSKIVRARNNKLIFYTLIIYGFLAFNVLGTGGCKWNSDYRSRIQPSPEPKTLSAEEANLQDTVNESELDLLKSAVPAKGLCKNNFSL